MKRSSPLLVALVLLSSVAGCGTSSTSHPLDGGGGGSPDLSIPDGGPWTGTCDVQHPCPSGQRCFEKQCIPDNGTCTSDDNCQNDSYCDCTAGGGGDAGACMGGLCIPWGTGPRGLFDPSCQGGGFAASQFVAPQLKCKYDANNPTVLTTPIVADLDGDGKPEVIFSAYPDRFIAIHGADCTPLFDKKFSFYSSNQTEIAVADLDGDKVPEIIGIDANRKVVVFDNQGNLLATSPTPYSLTGAVNQDWSAPAVADVDNKPPAEIIVAGQVTRYTKGQAALQVLFTNNATGATWGNVSIAADLDGDHKPELITGREVYDGVTGADKTPAAIKALTGPGAYPAVADFNKDGKPDLVLVQSAQGAERVSVFDVANNKFLFGPFDVPNGWGGPPTVADFDGDGIPDFGTAGPDNYFVFSLRCDPKNKAADCDQTSNIGILWKKKTQDHSSGGTGSSVFDFNGDGKAEVVYRDECWLRVYSGTDGKTLFAANVTSVTCLEEPVIADVDNDGHAEIVVAGDGLIGLCPNTPEADTNTPWSGAVYGVRIFQDPMNRWMPSRGLWNEQSYHITNISDDQSVPAVESDNWTSFNDYRQNVQGTGKGAAPQSDYTGGGSTGIDTGQPDCTKMWILRANVCNRGAAPAPAGIPGAFYASDPRTGNPAPICTTKTVSALKPGDCETVSCSWNNPPQVPTDLWFRADDDGSGKMPQGECKKMNDLLFQPKAACMKIG